MIASERSLASAHQTQSQQQRQQTATLVKARNGATKPPVRPVKIYVIDPRKLQQRLEAYVDQKNHKRAADVEAEKERLDKEKQEKDKPEKLSRALLPPPTPPLPPSKSFTISANSIAKPSPPKLFPLVPKFIPAATTTSTTTASSTAPSVTTNLGLSHHENGVLGNGVTLQSLPCINGASLGLPALPLVVTNGVALIQPSISQSSIPTGGLFLPGVTAIPSLVSSDGTFIGPPPQHLLTAKPRVSTTPKRKPKKKKAVKKRKAVEEREKEDEDDGELSYLLKETTTRAGRVSRPVSQPHSPSVNASKSSTSSRAPSPTSSLKAKKARKEEQIFKCVTCSQVFINEEKLKSHAEECPLRKQENSPISSQPLQQTHFSTNSSNDQGSATNQSVPPSPPVPVSSFPTSIEGITAVTTSTSTSTSGVLTQSMQETTPAASQSEISETINRSGSNQDLLAKSEQGCSVAPPIHVDDLPANTPAVEEEPDTSIAGESYPSNSLNFSISTSTIGQRNECRSTYVVSAIDTNAQSGTSAPSIVPTVNESHDLFTRCLSTSSSVVQVPSSYSLPSSPPSQCHSPGLPENVFGGVNLLAKQPSASYVPTCNSPIDPMLLRSRSPFPHPIPETSLHSNGASNLSIPEESLCKGELFMDFGEGMLGDTTNLSAISPFCNNDSAINQLFNDSSMKESTDEPQPREDDDEDEEEALPQDPDTTETEPRNVKCGPPTVTPMLLETTTEDANDGEIFQTANFVKQFLHPSIIPSITHSTAAVELSNPSCEERSIPGRTFAGCSTDFPRTPQSVYLESDISMDSSEAPMDASMANNQRCRSIWQFVKDQIKSRGISQACGEISEMADKLSRIARDHFIPIREEEIERLGNASSIIHVDTPFFSHLLDLPFGMYIFKEDAGTRKKIPPPPPMTSSELSFTGGVEDVEKFLPPDIDLISLPHLTNLDLT